MQTQSCGWEPLFDTEEPCEQFAGLSLSMQETLLQAAADLLWSWTGRVFGVCPEVIRPCHGSRCSARDLSTFRGLGPTPRSGYGGRWLPVILHGDPHMVSCGDCLSIECGCEAVGPRTLLLPGPIHSVTEIRIDGLVLPSSDYEVRDRRRLIRLDGGTWPTSQDFELPDTSPGTWSIAYERGIPVPLGGRLALTQLVCELAYAYVGDDECRLPQRVQTITRQGVTVGIADGFQDLEEGRTGIWEIDAWISSVTTPQPFVGIRSPDYRPHR